MATSVNRKPAKKAAAKKKAHVKKWSKSVS